MLQRCLLQEMIWPKHFCVDGNFCVKNKASCSLKATFKRKEKSYTATFSSLLNQVVLIYKTKWPLSILFRVSLIDFNGKNAQNRVPKNFFTQYIWRKKFNQFLTTTTRNSLLLLYYCDRRNLFFFLQKQEKKFIFFQDINNKKSLT